MIGWLLGGTTALGLAGILTLAIYIARQARNNRTDLLEVNKLVSALADERISKAALEHSMGDLNEVLGDVQDELARERAASQELQRSLSTAYEEMAKSGTASGAVLALRGALDRLSNMSPVPSVAAHPDDHGAGGVHGTTPSDDRGDGLKDRDS